MDHILDMQEHRHAAFQDVGALVYLVQPVAQPAGDGVHAEIQPFAEDGFQVFLARPAVQAQHHQIHRHIAFQAGLRQQQGDEFVRVVPAGFGFEHQPHRLLLVGFVAHPVQLAQHQALEVLLLGRQRFFAGAHLGVGQLFDFRQHFLR